MSAAATMLMRMFGHPESALGRLGGAIMAPSGRLAHFVHSFGTF
jgi:hypothetical protein